LSVINYTSGAPQSVAAVGNPVFMTGFYSFEDEDDRAFIPLTPDTEFSATSDSAVFGFSTMDSEESFRVNYFQFDAPSRLAEYDAMFQSVVVDSDEYYNGDGDDDDGRVARGVGDMTQCDLGVPHYVLSGVTRDASGVALAGVDVDIFDNASHVLQADVLSDGSGNYSANLYYPGPFFAVGYKSGSPDVAGTTLQTLTATPQ